MAQSLEEVLGMLTWVGNNSTILNITRLSIGLLSEVP